MEQTEYKKCKKCKIEFSKNFYYTNNSTKDSLTIYCKACIKQKQNIKNLTLKYINVQKQFNEQIQKQNNEE